MNKTVSNRQDDGSHRKIGVARALSKLGYCSRSAAWELVRAGEVKVNAVVQRDPEFPVIIGADRITVGEAEAEQAERVYLAMNKPGGIVTTASDEKNRRTVYDLLPADTPWVGPVGRLDKASEGLLLLTNDSEWAARITEPATHLDKTYHVQVASQVEEPLLTELATGRPIEGEWLRMKSAVALRSGPKNAWLEITLDEGKNRQIRRLLKSFDIEVLRVVRISIGPLILGDLPKGAVRKLTAGEKAMLDRAIRNPK